MRTFLGTAVLAMTLAAFPAMADTFGGNYKVTGTDPEGGPGYAGTVQLTKTGAATYSVVWKIGKDTFKGTGIGGAEGLAVGYTSGSSTGIAIYQQDASGTIKGVWTYAGGKNIGEETWSR